MKTTACILLLAAAGWAQEVAVPQGGSLGPSSKLSDAASLNADKVDSRHSSATPAANAVPAADSNGKLAPGWLPLPTPASLGGVFMDAGCPAGNHVSGINAASGRLECSADAADWSSISNKPESFPPDPASAAWQNLLGALALKAPLADAALTGATTAEQITASNYVQVGSGTPAVTVSYLGAGDADPAGSCSGGAEILKATADASTKRFYCHGGNWAEDVPAASALSDPGAAGVVKRTTQNTTAVAGYSDIVALWAGCGAGYLKADGTCGESSGEATPALSEDAAAVSSAKTLKAPEYQSTASSDQSFDLPTAVSPAVSASGHVKLNTDGSKLQVSENGGGFVEVAKRSQIPASWSAIVAMWTSCTAGYLKYDGTCSTMDSETTPSLTEDSSNVNSSKPLVIAGTQAKVEGGEGTAVLAGSGKGALSFNSATHRPAYSYDGGAAKDASLVIGGGTAVMGTSAISSGQCATVVTVSATGVLTTDVIQTSFNGDPTAVTGYGVSATGAVLTIYPYPTANNVNFKVCNSTSGSITPGALTLNWRVVR